jgi:hypothetical protein
MILVFHRKQPEVVGIQKWQTSQNVTEQPRPRSQQPDERRRQIHAVDRRIAIWKEVTDFFSPHTSYFRIPRIIEKEIKPQNRTIRF